MCVKNNRFLIRDYSVAYKNKKEYQKNKIININIR